MHLRFVLMAGATVLGLYLAASGAATGPVGSPVADAARKGDLPGLRSLIGQHADVNAPQADGATAIQWAAYRNDLAMADLLIGAGANVKHRARVLRSEPAPQRQVLGVAAALDVVPDDAHVRASSRAQN